MLCGAVNRVGEFCKRLRCETAQVHPPQPGRTDHSVWLSLPSTLAKL